MRLFCCRRRLGPDDVRSRHNIYDAKKQQLTISIAACSLLLHTILLYAYHPLQAMMQHLIAIISLILLASPASAFQSLMSMTQPQQRSHHTQQPLAATPTNTNDSNASNTDNNPLQSRRNMLVATAATTNLAFLSSPFASSANAAVLRSAGCVYGEGEACADLAEGNEFILSLQKKSAENKEANQRVR